MRSSKRGQMEILGLVFIVILVVMGLLLLLLFVGKGTPTLRRFQESALAKNYLTTLAQTQTDCRERTVEGLLQECSSGGLFTCENGQDACRYVQDAIDDIADATLIAWNRNYSLSVRTGQVDLLKTGLVAQGTRCPGDVEGSFYHIPYAGSVITMNLSLCA